MVWLSTPLLQLRLPRLRPRLSQTASLLQCRVANRTLPPVAFPATTTMLSWPISHSGGQQEQQQQQQQQQHHEQRRTMMAGHNKWSKIRHKKGANDRKKAVILGKASKGITVASRDCKGDRSDVRLQAAIQHAKSVQLTKDRIEEAIDKGIAKNSNNSSSGGGGDFESLRFDAMMKLEDNYHSGDDSSSTSSSVQVACIVTALSDNRNRTTQHVRHLVTKYGGEFLPTDHLNYLFDHVGHVLVEFEPPGSGGNGNGNGNDEDSSGDDGHERMLVLEEELMECALEAGATNVEPAEDDYDDDDDNGGEEEAAAAARFVVTTEDKDLWKVVRALRGDDAVCGDDSGDANDNGSKWKLVRIEHRYVLREDYGEVAGVHSDSPARERLEDFLDQLEDNEDVHKVHHNAALVRTEQTKPNRTEPASE